jgi:hypothetical protein
MKTLTMKVKISTVNAYILDCINTDDFNVNAENNKEKLQFLANTFKSEYVYPENLKRYKTYERLMGEWIMGLPTAFSVAYSYCDILQLAKEWGAMTDNATEKEEDSIIENWFKFIGTKTIQLMNAYDIYSYEL